MWLVFAALRRGRGNQMVEPILLFRCQRRSIGGGWGPAVAHTSLDGEYSTYAASGRNKIEGSLVLGTVLDEDHDIVVLFSRDLKPPDCLAHLGELLDGNLLLVGRNPQKVGNVRGQESIVPLLQGLVHGQGQALVSLRRRRVLRVGQREGYDPQD